MMKAAGYTELAVRQPITRSIRSAHNHRIPAPHTNRTQPSSIEGTHRRSLLQSLILLPALVIAPPSKAELSSSTVLSDEDLATVTDRVFLDFGMCPEGVRADRRLGDKTILCTDPEPIGRIVIALYGRAAPGTVANFKTLIRSGALEGSCLSKIFPGQWLVAGQQGARRSGLLEAPPGILSNPDVLSPTSFRLGHLRPGTVSLNLSNNEDEESIRYRKYYRPLSFLITTGPGALSLDGENIVFGTVVEGLENVATIATVPTFGPKGNVKAYNDFANFIGDERASKTKAKWGKPLKAVVITKSGVLE